MTGLNKIMLRCAGSPRTGNFKRFVKDEYQIPCLEEKSNNLEKLFTLPLIFFKPSREFLGDLEKMNTKSGV